MKSTKIRTAAKVFLWLGIVLLLATLALTFAYLTTQDFFPLEFTDPQLNSFVNKYLNEWLYPTALGGVSALFLILSLILACAARGAERREYEALYDCANCYTEEEPDFEQIPTIKEKKSVKEMMGTVGEKLKDKKVLTIGAVALSALTVGALAVSVSSNVKHAKRAKRRREFYKWLG